MEKLENQTVLLSLGSYCYGATTPVPKYRIHLYLTKVKSAIKFSQITMKNHDKTIWQSWDMYTIYWERSKALVLLFCSKYTSLHTLTYSSHGVEKVQ